MQGYLKYWKVVNKVRLATIREKLVVVAMFNQNSKVMKLYYGEIIDAVITKYLNAGGEVFQVSEGVLTSGDWILYDTSGKLKNFIIKEVYLNDWSSAQTIRSYKKLPKKYERMIV